MDKSEKLINHILKYGKDLTWKQLANKYGYNTEDAARKAWKKYESNEVENLIVKKKTTNAKGKDVFTTYVNKPIDQPDLSNAKLKKTWVIGNTVGRSYEHSTEYGITQYDFDRIYEEISDNFLDKSIDNNTSGTGVIIVADLHTGAVLKALQETLLKQEFNTEILTQYLGRIVTEVNAKKYEKVHLLMPGDFIESFTAFNHKDTWKKVEHAQGDILKIAYKILYNFFSKINNLEKVYMIEGNHDRWTDYKETNSRKGIADALSFFLGETTNINIKYHPWLITNVIDNINYISTHGDWKPHKKGYDGFLFKYGNQDLFNIFVTAHYHYFTTLESGVNFLHVQSPAVFTGGFFEEALGYTTLPGYLDVRNWNDKPQIIMTVL